MFNIGIPEALFVLTPGAEWSMTNVQNYETLVWYSQDIPKPSEAAINAEIARQVAYAPIQATKDQAKKLIAASDWSVLPDVGLANQAEFIAYRSALRALITSPVANPVWPTEPQPIWS